MDKPCTVGKYLHVLTSALTQYDMAISKREAKRGVRPNIYRLGIYFQAKQAVEKEVKKLSSRSDPEALGKFVQSMEKHFLPNFPPLKKVEKQIASGRCNYKG